MTTAPFCPTSFSQLPYGRQWALDHNIKDLVNSIPRATDLRSAISALNIINNIIMQIARGAPQVNNTYIPKESNVIIKDAGVDPKYKKADWIEEERGYRRQKLVNIDNSDQVIEIKTLSYVNFVNLNLEWRLEYDGTW